MDLALEKIMGKRIVQADSSLTTFVLRFSDETALVIEAIVVKGIWRIHKLDCR